MLPANPLARPNVSAVTGTNYVFDEVYRAHFAFVWRCLQGLGVAAQHLDDVAQDVFVIVHRRLSDFRGDSSLRTWLYAIVRNLAANHRRRLRRQPLPDTLAAEPPSPAPGPHELAADRETLDFVQTYLATLDDSRRELFVLILLEELPVTEVAEILQIPLNTAYTRLRSVRLEFERALAQRDSHHDG
jgi:RNA polymerase sigma-70 factor, ECF subfamily